MKPAPSARLQGMESKLRTGDSAPDFSLPSTEGTVSLEDHRGEWVVLYFYPKDNTLGCTQQACDLRDNLGRLDATVIGVSPDGLESHAKFKADHGLNFPLVSDTDSVAATAYGAWGQKNVFGNEVTGIIRSTFIIDPEGKVAAALYNVKAKGHADRIAGLLEDLRTGATA